MKLIILGDKGMLGHMLVKYFTKQKFTILTTSYRWPSNEFKEFVIKTEVDYVINCIGAIPQKYSLFDINFELPIWLDSNVTCKIIHPSTDCEGDLDDYGISKRRATDYLLESGTNTKIIHGSIIGPELETSKSLFSWILSHKDKVEVNGYKNQFWNGVTTYFWASVAHRIIVNPNVANKITRVGSECISKYELLKIICYVYQRRITIKEFFLESDINKCLVRLDYTQGIEEQLVNMKAFYEKSEK